MPYSDGTSGVVARLTAERPDVTTSVRLYEGMRPACRVSLATGAPIREGAVWRQRLDLNAYPGLEATEDDALDLIDELRRLVVTRGWTDPGWAAGGIVCVSCSTLVDPQILPDLSPREPRALVTIEVVYRLPQQDS